MSWDGSCSIPTLPPFMLELGLGKQVITRMAPWGSWYAQYSGNPYSDSETVDGFDFDFSVWYRLEQLQPVRWRAPL